MLHTETVSTAWSLGLRNLIIPGRGEILPVAGRPFDDGRNHLCKVALSSGFSHILMMDSDLIPPSNGIIRLLQHNLPLVSGLYCRRSPPHSVPVMIRNGIWVTNFVPNSLVEVDMVGSGFMLIRRDLLEAFKPQRPQAGKHWFDWRVDMQGMTDPTTGKPYPNCLSEDFTFCVACKEQLGVKTIVDTSIQCLHIGLAESSQNRFVPAEVRTRT